PMVGYPMEVRGVKGYSGGGGKTGRRQANGEPRPAPRLGRRVDRAAVLLDDAAADAEPEAGPHLPLGGEERLPDPGQGLGGDPDPVVLDLHERFAAVAEDADADPPALARRLDRVAHQVDEHLQDLLAVDLGGDVAVVRRPVDPAQLERRLEAEDRQRLVDDGG